MEYKGRNKMKQNEKKEITERLDNNLDFEGDLESTIKSLQKTMKNHRKKGFYKFDLEQEQDWDYGLRESNDTFTLMGTRLETDEELAKRIASNKKKSKVAKLAAKTRAIKKVERERKQYLKLHAKFKGKI